MPSATRPAPINRPSTIRRGPTSAFRIRGTRPIPIAPTSAIAAATAAKKTASAGTANTSSCPPAPTAARSSSNSTACRQAGRFFLNGKAIGKYENGVTPVGLDLTKFVKFGGQDNLLAVKVDNSPGYREEATGTAFLWNAKDFNPNFGGLNRDATLIVAGKIYQTLPLYENLGTTGIYVYPEAIDLQKKTAEIKVEAEVVNDAADYASITLSAVVVDADGVVRAKLEGNTSDLVAGQSEVFTASGTLTALISGT